MLFSRASSLLGSEFTLKNYLSIAEALCHAELCVIPIFECVKVFARIDESGQFAYARHRLDLGTTSVSKAELSERIKDTTRREVVLNALTEVEDRCHEIWPFSPGSATWVLLEILHPEIKIASRGNNPTVIFRGAHRISSKGRLSETSLTKGLFSDFQRTLVSTPSGKFEFSFNPTIKLNNISGTGAFSKFKDEHESVAFLVGENKKLSSIPSGLREHYESIFNTLLEDILENNFSIEIAENPGFMFSLNESSYRVQGLSFTKKKKLISEESKKKPLQPPPPLFGIRR